MRFFGFSHFSHGKMSVSVRSLYHYVLMKINKSKNKRKKSRTPNSMPFLIFRRDHLRSTSGIICGSGSFAVQSGDHFRSGDHLRSGIIWGAVQISSHRDDWVWESRGMDCQSAITETEGNLLSCSFCRISFFFYHRLIFCSSDDFQFRVFPVNDLVLDE